MLSRAYPQIPASYVRYRTLLLSVKFMLKKSMRAIDSTPRRLRPLSPSSSSVSARDACTAAVSETAASRDRSSVPLRQLHTSERRARTSCANRSRIEARSRKNSRVDLGRFAERVVFSREGRLATSRTTSRCDGEFLYISENLDY